MKITDEDKELSKSEKISVKTAQTIRLENEAQSEQGEGKGDVRENFSTR